MRKLLLLLIIILTTPIAIATQTEISNDSTFRIDLKEHDPIIIGDESTLIFEIRNLESYEIKNLEFEAADKFPFEVMGENKLTIDLKPAETKTLKFKIKIAADSQAGTYPFALQYPLPKTGIHSSTTFDITTKRITRTIASTKIKTTPEQIRPGDKAEIEVKIENIANHAMKDIIVKLNFTDTVPIVPYASTSEKQIKEISPGSSSTVTFPIIAEPDADPGAYKLIMKLTYDDELGNEDTREEWIGILISSAPDYLLNIEDSTPIKRTKSPITISISNTGPSDIKYLVLEILPNKYYRVVGQDKAYIGNIEPDDYETEEFDIYPKRSEDIPIKVKLTYKDAFNQDKIETKTIQTKVLSRTSARSLGIIPKSGTTKLIIYVLIIIFIYLTYKNWKKEKNLPKSMKLSLLSMMKYTLKIIRNLKWKKLKRLPHKIRIFLIKLR